MMIDLSKKMCGRTICVLADAAAFPCESIVSKFREEFDARIAAGDGHERTIPRGGPLVQPGALSAHNQEKLEELQGGH